MIETTSKVKQIIAKILKKEEAEIIESASLVDQLGADSLDSVEIIMALEEAFSIKIEDDAAEDILTVGDAIQQILESVGAKNEN